jgi:hypothetical protein
MCVHDSPLPTLRVPPAVVCRSSAAVRPRRTQVSSLRYTACHGMSLGCVWCCAPSLGLCPHRAVPPAVAARPLLFALAAPVPSLRRTTSRGMLLVHCWAPSLGLCPLRRATSRGKSLVRCCSPSLRLFLLCAYHQPWYVTGRLLCALAGPVPRSLYHQLWSVARPLLGALAAPMSSLRYTACRGIR